MSYKFIVENYNHPPPDSGLDIIFHAGEIEGVVPVNTLAKFDVEGSEYRFEVVYLEKNRKERKELSSSDAWGGIGVKFVSPKECIRPRSPSIWVNLFSGKRVECLSIPD